MPLILKLMQQWKAFIKSLRAIHLDNLFIEGVLEIEYEHILSQISGLYRDTIGFHLFIMVILNASQLKDLFVNSFTTNNLGFLQLSIHPQLTFR